MRSGTLSRVNIPKEAPLQPLTGDQRFKLYLRQTYTTPGIYVKTALFSIHDQVNETEPDWGDGVSGFGKRLGSLHAGNIIQELVNRARQCRGRIRAPL
jgi:hypothetical protein